MIEAPAALEERLRSLAVQWRKETAFMSSSTQIQAHPAFLSMVGFGDPAIPFLLGMLDEPGHWTMVLWAITKVNPVSFENRGRRRESIAAWKKWGATRASSSAETPHPLKTP